VHQQGSHHSSSVVFSVVTAVDSVQALVSSMCT
jgi:hypothetical protein